MTADPANQTLAVDDPVASLRRKHQALLARLMRDPPRAEERSGFMRELQEAGRIVRNERARDSLKSMLFYWAADATTRGDRKTENELPRLEPFIAKEEAEQPATSALPDEGAASPAESLPPEANSSITQVIEAIQSAQKALPAGPAGGSGGLVGAILTQKGAASAIGKVLGGLMPGAGMAGGIAGMAGGIIEALHPAGTKTSLPPPPPRPAEGSVPISDIEAVARARAILRFSAFARQWQRAEPANQADFLLKGNALIEAQLYVEDDPDIREHVKASRHAAEDASRQDMRAFKQRVILMALLAIGAVTLIASVVVLNFRLDAKQKLAEALEKVVDTGPLNREERQNQVTPKVESNTIANTARAVPRDAPPVILPTRNLVIEPCSGYLWFGSATDSRIIDRRDPALLKPGEDITISLVNDIRLRETAPSPDTYTMGRQVGLVPAGGTVRILETVPAFKRPSGAQVWAKVQAPRQFCTSVFVQYNGPADRLGDIKDKLQEISVLTPPAEALASAAGRAEVRYFWPADASVATQIALTLAPFSKDQKPLKLTPLTDLPEKLKPRPTTIEVWLDLKP